MVDMMTSTDVIDLCSDDEEDNNNNIKLIQSNISTPPPPPPFFEQFDPLPSREASSSQWADQIQSFPVRQPLHFSSNGDHQFPASRPVPLCRQFWKAGDCTPSSNYQAHSGGQNRFRVHPKFLHSNATSHKWAFGGGSYIFFAIAELLDNAIDEVKNGATFVKLDKMQNPRDGRFALLIQDDGGGMGSDSLRGCMSFGFSDKCDGSSIGQYGNGFKTSTMRLGADVLVFSRSLTERGLVQSVGLLSYTFLTTMGFDDIIVPIVDYEYDAIFGAFKRLLRSGERQFLSNLSIILDWSPFANEMQLLNQLNEIGTRGTRIIVFNLWLNDAGDLELDFISDEKDIMISGAHKPEATNLKNKLLNEMHVANRFRYSLRAYASILYLHLPEKFRIILCGSVVEPHYIVSDLIYCECIKYAPQVGHRFEAEVITTIGFLNGAPDLNIHGFNIYHKNRLILPFWAVALTRKCRGISGVLEANYIKPTHDKQDFERSALFQKLEARLREMALEKFHCHLVGYMPETPIRSQTPHIDKIQTPLSVNETVLTSLTLGPTNNPQQSLHGPGAHEPTANRRGSTGSNEPRPSVYFEPVIIGKRRNESEMNANGASKRQAVSNELGSKEQEEKRRLEGSRIVVSENKKLRFQCLEYEMAEKELLLKVQRLTSELEEAQQVYRGLLTELDTLNHLNIQTF